MRVAIVHYHLRRGGVTRVIENAVSALAPHGVEIVVLSGEPYPGDSLENVQVVEGLAYRGDILGGPEPRELADSLLSAAREGLGGQEPDVWHIHNHSLGKNAAFIHALNILFGDGRKVLLQIHDFAEDGRPSNYRVLRTPWQDADPARTPKLLYPLASGIHYATLNARDLRFLEDAGAPAEQLHLLANPISIPDPTAEADAGERPFDEVEKFILYPARGIRRKNLGELVLLAAACGEGTLLATTLGPENPHWQPVHDRWQQFAKERKLPLQLAAADNPHSFPALLSRADALISTSVAEGFGLAFLEPWVLGKPLMGRDLPEITQDFKQEGLDLSSLYRTLAVPVAFLDMKSFKKTLHSALANSCETYGWKMEDANVKEAIQSWISEDMIDFGVLDEPTQEQVIDKVLSSDEARASIREQLFSGVDGVDVEQNRRVVQERFSLPTYGEKLLGIYKLLAAAPVEPVKDGLDALSLLGSFMDPRRFRLLRS